METSIQLPTSQTKHRCESARDGSQGGEPQSACRLLTHILQTNSLFHKMSIGWIYTNPVAIEVARYLRSYMPDMGLVKDSFFIYTLVHRGSEPYASLANNNTAFGSMLLDCRRPNRPFNTINVLTKARVADLRDFGDEVTSTSFIHGIDNTFKLIKEANTEINLEIALEHFYTAWLETPGQEENRKHIIDTLVCGILNGVVCITAPDTDGAHTPQEIGRVIKEVTLVLQADERLRNRGIIFTPEIFSAHMHNDLGKATANTISAINAGAGHCDSAMGPSGERGGNARIPELLEQIGGTDPKLIELLKKYETGYTTNQGLRLLTDKKIGSPEAFCAVGGMHASKILSEWLGNDLDWHSHCASYSGSYATVSPAMFGQSIEVTTSPVAGGSNVLCMLASLGVSKYDIRKIKKNDPRILAVLDQVKHDEHHRGINYRGYKNVNALLLVAETFGLVKSELRPNITEYHLNSIVPADYLRDQASLFGRSSEENTFYDDLANLNEAFQLLDSYVDPRYKSEYLAVKSQLRIDECRQYEVVTGTVTPRDGDPKKPTANEGFGIKILFYKELLGRGKKIPVRYQANGVGDSYIQALKMATEQMLYFGLVEHFNRESEQQN